MRRRQSRRLGRQALWFAIGGVVVVLGAVLAVTVSRNEPESPDQSFADLAYAYVSDREGSGDVVMLHARGRTDTQVSPPGMIAFAPSWDLSGCRLAYVAQTREGIFQVRLWTARDGRPPRDRVLTESAGPISDVAWADQDLVVIRSSRVLGAEQLGDSDGRQEIVRVALDGEVRLLSRSDDGAAASYGQVTANPITSSVTVTVVDEAGVASLQLVGEESRPGSKADALPTGTTMAASWDSTGTRLAFVREAKAGWSLAILERGEAERTIARSERLLYAPSWSSDQTAIVYERYTDTNPDLWVVDTETGRSQPLLSGPGFEGMPAVAPPCDGG